MKEIILKLIRDYYSKRMIIKDVMVIGRGLKQTIRIMHNLAPNAWKIYRGGIMGNPPDIKLAGEIIEGERKNIADELYIMTSDILIIRNKQSDFDNLQLEKNVDTHSQKMSYCIRALLWMDVISEFDVQYSIEIQDEEGDLVGMRRLPKGGKSEGELELEESEEDIG